MKKRGSAAGCRDVPTAVLRGRPLAALRAIVSAPNGLRREAYPTAMPLLVASGYAIEGAVRGEVSATAWFVTEAGHAYLRRHGLADGLD